MLANQQAVLKPHNFTPQLRIAAEGSTHAQDITLNKLFEKGHANDRFPQDVLDMLRNKVRHSTKVSLADCKEKHGRLHYRDKVWVPDYMPLRLRIIQDHHDPPAMGHPGKAKTLELITWEYYWPNMRRDIDQFVRNCHTCRRTKATRHAPYGVLKPLPVPKGLWKHLSVDFITGLLES